MKVTDSYILDYTGPILLLQLVRRQLQPVL
jgi:hypothetical protein